jgi:serine phosphatase RsbU (regulator of sigma subunit)
MYETARLTAALARAHGLEPVGALERVVADLDSFADGHEPEDDQTLVLLSFA